MWLCLSTKILRRKKKKIDDPGLVAESFAILTLTVHQFLPVLLVT